MPNRSLLASALVGLVTAQVAGLLLADAGVVRARALLAAAVGLAALAAFVRPRLRVALALLAVGGASGSFLAQRLERAATARPTLPIARTLEGRIAARDVRPGWIRLDLEEVVAADDGDATPEALRLQGRSSDSLVALSIGDRIRARVVLEALAVPHNPGARDVTRSLARAGFGAIARVVDPGLVIRRLESGDASAGEERSGWIERLRRRAGERLGREGSGGALLRALACGERAGLPEETRLAFQELGLSHLLSVSGLHLVLVAGFAYAAAIRALRRVPRLPALVDVRRPALLLAFTASVFYSVFSGFEVPMQRSLVFVAGAALALARRRPLRGRSVLAAAAFLVLAFRPAALFDAGAQMSFAASAALLALRRQDDAAAVEESRAARLLRAIAQALSTSAAATAATVPIAATHMGVVAPMGLIANLIFVPWTGILVLPAALVAAALAALPGERAASAALVALCARVAGWTCEAVERLAAWTPDLPPSGVPGPLAFLACAVLAIGATRAPRLVLRLGAALASCALLALSPPPGFEPAVPRVVFIDVGQGDSTLVQGREASVLVDAGLALPDGMDLGRTTVLPALSALGVTRLDLLIVTHGDADHRGGVPAVLRSLPVALVWIPPGAGHEPSFEALRAVARARGVSVQEIGADDTPLRVGDLRVTPLWPPGDRLPPNRNDRSLVVRISAGEGAVLLPGDIEATAEEALVARGVELQSDVLKLAHHGSRTSSTPAFLAAVRPRLGIASAPCAGRFGMPHPEVVERLDGSGIAWRWTGRDGALLVGLDRVASVHAYAREPLICVPGRLRDVSPRSVGRRRGARSEAPGRKGNGHPRRGGRSSPSEPVSR